MLMLNETATLKLVKTARGRLLLQACGDANIFHSMGLLDIDGDDYFPLTPVKPLEEVKPIAYDPNDLDSFWAAHAALINNARNTGINIPKMES